jgi:hypothetical protein
MAETTAEASESKIVFRVGNRPLILVAAMLAMFAVVPVESLYELATTGMIDMDAVTPTRRMIPVWQLYATMWPIFLLALWSVRPLLPYFLKREMFRLNQWGIAIHGVTLAPEEVLGFRYSFLRGHVLQSTRGDFPIHPWMIKGAVEALTAALPHVPPLRQGKVPSWLLDD